MSAIISGVFGAGTQFFTNAGVVLSGGLLNTYLAGTTTAQATWTDSTQGTANANPIVLTSAGRLPNEVWLASSTNYKFVLTDSVGGAIGTWDNIPGIAVVAATSEWAAGTTPTYISATSFSVSGNLVATWQVNRRVQYTVTAGTYYGTITASVYNGSTITTVTIVADSTGLDSSLSAVNYGFLSAINYSIPAIYPYTTAANSWTAVQTFTNSDIRLLGSSTGYTTFTSANAGASNYTMTFPAATATLAGLSIAQTWTAVQTFTNSDIRLLGSSTGATTFTSANAGASNYTITLPAVTDTMAVKGTNTFTAAQIGTVQALSVASNLVAVDLSLANDFSLALQATTGQTLSNPTNAVAGQAGQIVITQNATASTLAYGTNWISTDGTTPTVSTTASTQNLLSYYVADATHVWFSLSKHGVT